MPPTDLPAEPILVTTATDEELARWRSGLGGARVSEVDGSESGTEEALFAQLAKAFDAPPHFGRNWDAVHDVLVDLSWIEADGHILLVDHAWSLLTEAASERFAAFLAVMSSLAEEWAEAGGNGQRRRMVFRTVLRTDAGERDLLLERIGEDADVADLPIA